MCNSNHALALHHCTLCHHRNCFSGNFNFRCNFCGLCLRDGSRDYHLKKVPSSYPTLPLRVCVADSLTLHVSVLFTFAPAQVHSDILASIRAGLRKPQPKAACIPSATFSEGSPALPASDSTALAAAKEDDGLILRRATRQRAKARIDAIFDVVAHAELMVRMQLKKLDLPSELCDAIR
jgi:hypothetical protein